jgi:hypothetical protein
LWTRRLRWCAESRSRFGARKPENEGSHLGRQYFLDYGGAAFAERAAELFKDMISAVSHWSFLDENADLIFRFQ